jgi:hypothetical protein
MCPMTLTSTNELQVHPPRRRLFEKPEALEGIGGHFEGDIGVMTVLRVRPKLGGYLPMFDTE